MDPYATHLEALLAALAQTTGPVIELGCSHYSTPVMRTFTKQTGRRYVIASSNPVLSASFRNQCDELIAIKDWTTWEPSSGYGLCLLDNEQTTTMRFPLLKRLLTKVPVVVVHDADRYEQNGHAGWKEILACTPHQWFKTFLPWTVILSPGSPKAHPLDFFDGIYCINLPGSIERWKKCEEEFGRAGILQRVQRIHVTPPKASAPVLRFPQGEMGVSLSHLKVLLSAINSNVRHALIFEDDVKFRPGWEIPMGAVLSGLPKAWDVLYLGGKPLGALQPVADCLARVSSFVCTHAYAVSRSFMPTFASALLDQFTFKACDSILSDLAGSHKFYSAYPPVCDVYSGPSVIRNNEHRDYSADVAAHWRKFAPPSRDKSPISKVATRAETGLGLDEMFAASDARVKASPTRHVILVCRSGGEYKPEHVERICRFLKDCTVTVLTDFAAALFPGINVIPLKYKWKGWWSKMELFRPEITGIFLYVDLDTTVFGRLPDEYFCHPSNLALEPFASTEYRNQPGYHQSGMMLLHERGRTAIWERWIQKPDFWMTAFRGDQDFLHSSAMPFDSWQKAFPGQIVSYKVNWRRNTLHDGSALERSKVRVVCFHGNPRPWSIPPLQEEIENPSTKTALT